jgi:hypothetical protein
MYPIKCFGQIKANNPYWQIESFAFIQNQICSEHMFFHPPSCPKTMLFFWLFHVQSCFDAMQNHVRKSFVEQTDIGNRPEIGC